jgi:hypothetical protein
MTLFDILTKVSAQRLARSCSVFEGCDGNGDVAQINSVMFMAFRRPAELGSRRPRVVGSKLRNLAFEENQLAEATRSYWNSFASRAFCVLLLLLLHLAMNQTHQRLWHQPSLRIALHPVSMFVLPR